MTEDIIQVRTSERRDYVTCRQKWWWAYVEKLTSKRTATPLWFGSLIHDALEHYYPVGSKRGPHPAETAAARLDELQIEGGMYTEEGEWEDARSLAVEMMNNYVDFYGGDKRYQIIAPEMPFQVEVYNEAYDMKYEYVGQIDAVGYDKVLKEVFLFEHKTTKGLPPDYWLPMDEQAGSYFAYGPDFLRSKGILKKGQSIDYILYNFLRKGRKDPRPQNELGQYLNQNGTVSKKQPSPLFHREIVHRTDQDRLAIMDRVDAVVWEMEQVRLGNLPVYKNPRKECKYMCQFRDMCELHEAGADWEYVRDTSFTVWNPYEAHMPENHEEPAES